MDIEYLLLLQEFRASTGDVLSPFFSEVSKIAVGLIPFLLVCFVYWGIDRRAGKRIIFGAALGNFMNGLLKLTFCVYRPWIRDPRVLPFGDSKIAATGYSFPSGHTTMATQTFGGVGRWLWNKRRVISVLCWVFVLLVMFSRNYLGVHTPQDVLVGLLATLLMMLIAWRVEDWTDEDPQRDKIVMIAGVALCIAAAVFYFVKPYPLDYAADGTLLVDPAAMRAGSFEGLGFVAAYVICRYFERRGFAFDAQLTRKTRILSALVAFVPLVAWLAFAKLLLPSLIPNAAAKFLLTSVTVVYAMIIVPNVMRLAAKKQPQVPAAGK